MAAEAPRIVFVPEPGRLFTLIGVSSVPELPGRPRRFRFWFRLEPLLLLPGEAAGPSLYFYTEVLEAYTSDVLINDPLGPEAAEARLAELVQHRRE